ncbi:MAG: hypothetical protein EHM72_18010, partial [Calditrichaeota bacterium]
MFHSSCLKADKRVYLIILFIFSFAIGAQAQRWRIMPVGNSLTAGKDGVTGVEGDGFRRFLYESLQSGGLDFTFVGGRGNSPYVGHFQSGAKIEWFLPGGSMDIKTALDQYQPNIVLVHLGTNNLLSDIQGPYTQSNTSSYKLRQLINTISADGNVQYILLCKIVPRLDDNNLPMPQVKQYNKEIEAMFFANQVSAKTVLVDMYSSLQPIRDVLPDKIHPTSTGYQKMADEYARVIKALN